MKPLLASLTVGILWVALWIWTVIEGGKDEPWPTEED